MRQRTNARRSSGFVGSWPRREGERLQQPRARKGGSIPDTYEVFAIRYASLSNRKASENFIGGDPHESASDLDYFVWLARSKARAFVIDTGFDARVGARRGRRMIHPPERGLPLLGVEAKDVKDVVITDAAHLYANMNETRPFPIVFDAGAMVEGYRRLRELADSPELVVPGHDPLVMRRYPAPGAALEGIAVRLDRLPEP